MDNQKQEVKNTEGTKKDFIDNILDNYVDLEQSIVNQLNMYNGLHPTTTGTLREDIWMQLFEKIVPRKFVIEHSIFIIDSHGNISKEVDLAIIDNTYTPYIFQYGRLKYVPIEAVAAVVECKSTRITVSKQDDEGDETGGSLTGWCDSIKALKTSRDSVTRIATGAVINGITYGIPKSNQNNNSKSNRESQKESGKQVNQERQVSQEREKKYSFQTATRPIRIFCGYKSSISEDKKEEMEKLFDFILLATEEENENKENNNEKKNKTGKISITVNGSDDLKSWYMKLNHNEDEYEEIFPGDIPKLSEYNLSNLKVERDQQEISLITFNLQLNQLLMLINNPIMFPHLSYAKMFNREEVIPNAREKDSL